VQSIPEEPTTPDAAEPTASPIPAMDSSPTTPITKKKKIKTSSVKKTAKKKKEIDSTPEEETITPANCIMSEPNVLIGESQSSSTPTTNATRKYLDSTCYSSTTSPSISKDSTTMSTTTTSFNELAYFFATFALVCVYYCYLSNLSY